MMGKISLLILSILTVFLFSSCDSSSGCKTSADCGDASVCYDGKCVDVAADTATLSFDNINDGDSFDVSDDLSDAVDGIQLDISVIYDSESQFMENTGVVLSVTSDDKTSTYAGLFLDKKVFFSGITLPEGTVKLKAYSIINSDLSTEEITVSVTAVSSKLQINYLKDGAELSLDKASFTEADDALKDNNYFDLNIVVDASELEDGALVYLSFENQVPDSISVVIFQGKAVFEDYISFPFVESVTVTATSGDYSSSATFTLELADNAAITVASVCGKSPVESAVAIDNSDDNDADLEGIQCDVELLASEIDSSTEKAALYINDALFEERSLNSDNTAVFTVTFDDGTYSLKASMTNLDVLVESSVVTVTSNTSTMEAPVVTVVSPTNNLKPTWSWNSVTDAVNYRTSFDNVTWSETTALSYTPESDLNPDNTPFTLYVQAVGSDGKWSVSGLATVVIDVTAPVVTPVYPATASFNINLSNYATYIATGTSNLSLITVEADAAEENSQAVLKSGADIIATETVGTDRRVSFSDVPLTEDAVTSLTVEITDLAGNTSLPLNLTYRYDKTKPSISWVSPVANGDGDIIVSKSHDLSSSSSVYSINIKVNVSGAEAGSTINVSGALAYASPVSVTDAAAKDYTLTVQLEEGSGVDNDLTISISDLAGNSYELPVTIIVDTTVPTLKWNNVVNVSDSYKFTVNVYNIESGATVELLEKDSGSTVFGSAQTVGSLGSFEAVDITPSSIPDKCGAYSFYMRIYYTAESKYIYTTTSDDSTVDYREQIVDFNDPVITTVSITSDDDSDSKIGLNDDESSADSGIQTAMEFDVTGADGQTLTIYDGGSVKASGTVVSGKCYFDNSEHDGQTNSFITLTDGIKNLTATVVDCNGNVSATFNIPEFTVDSVSPVITITSPDQNKLIVSDGTGVDVDSKLEGVSLTISFGESLIGETLMIVDNVTDYSDTFVREDTVVSSLTVSSNPQIVALPALDYNKHSFTVTVPDSFGNSGTATRTYKVDPVAPTVVISAPADGLEINESNDADASTPGIQFTATVSYVVEPLQTVAELTLYALPVDASGNSSTDGRTDTTLLTMNDITADASNITLPSSSYFSLSSGYWQIKAEITDDNGNSSVSNINTVNVTSAQPAITVKTKNEETLFNSKWIKADEGVVSGSTFTTDIKVTTTDSIEGTWVELWVNGVKESSDAQIDSSGVALFSNVVLNLSESENTIKAVVEAGENYEYEYTGIKVDDSVPTLSILQPSIYTAGGKNELAYGYDDDATPGDSVLNFITAADSENFIKFEITDAVDGTVTVSGSDVSGTLTADVTEDAGTYFASFTGLSINDSVTGGQTDTDLTFTVTEEHDGQTTNSSMFNLTLHVNLENPDAPSFASTPLVISPETASIKLLWSDVAGNSSTYKSTGTAVEKYFLRYKSGACPTTVDSSFISTGTIPVASYAVVNTGLLDSDEGSVSGVSSGSSRDITFSVNRLKVAKLNLTSFSGTFAASDTVTGNISGATGTIGYTASQGEQQAVYLKSVTGTFTTGETITTSQSASGTISSKVVSDEDVHLNGAEYCVAMQSVDAVYAEDGTVLKENSSEAVTSVATSAISMTSSQLAIEGASVVANAGDIDGDGFDDIIFGDATAVNDGVGYLAVVSSTSGHPLLLEKEGTVSYEGYGQAVTAGDFNGDGNRDVAYLDYYGGVHILHGTGTALESSETIFTVANGCRINVADAESFASVGNTITIDSVSSTVTAVSGDIIYIDDSTCSFSSGVTVTNNTTPGTATLNYATSWFEANTGWYDSYGYIAAADVNGDGIDDIAATVPEQMIDGKSNAGALFVYYGNASKTYDGKYPDISVFGDNADDAFGSRIINAGYLKDGDVSGTRYESLLVGTNGSNIYSKLIYGNNYGSGSYDSDLDILTFNAGGTQLPNRSSKADLNEDSYDDLIISDRKNIYVYYGSEVGIGTGTLAEGLKISRSAIGLTNYSMSEEFAISVSSGCDFNSSGTAQDIYTVGDGGNIYFYEGEYISELPAVDRRNHPKVIYQEDNVFKVVMLNNGFVYCKNDYTCYISTY